MSVLGIDSGYTVKYNPLPSGVPSGFALGKSLGAALPGPRKTPSIPPLLLGLTQYVAGLCSPDRRSPLEELYKERVRVDTTLQREYRGLLKYVMDTESEEPVQFGFPAA